MFTQRHPARFAVLDGGVRQVSDFLQVKVCYLVPDFVHRVVPPLRHGLINVCYIVLKQGRIHVNWHQYSDVDTSQFINCNNNKTLKKDDYCK